jgi:zinc transport system substrate-binding protein
MIRSGVVVLAIAVGLCLALASPGCGGKSSSGKPKVVVSIFPLFDLTRRVAGDRLDVRLILPPGQSEHGYDPTPKEIAGFDGARLGITVGLGMDRWAEAVIASAGDPPVLRIAQHVPTIPIDIEPIGEADDHDHHDHGHARGHENPGDSDDPHVWLDPERMATAVDVIATRLTELDPPGKEAFAANASQVQQALRELDGKIAARAKTWTRRTIVTFHGSMAYFARRYGIRIAAVVEPVAGTEPTAAYIMEVVAAVKRGKAAALFTEPQLARGPGEVIAKEAQIPLGELDPIGGVAGRDSYEALLTWNADQLEKALQ